MAFEAAGQVALTSSYTNSFPTGGNTAPFAGSGSVASWVYWYGLGHDNTPMTNDVTMDAQNNTNVSGSLLVYSGFGTAADQNVFFGTFGNGYSYDPSETIAADIVTNLAFDIRVQPGAKANASGNFGSLSVALIDPSWGGNFKYFTPITIPAAATNGWVHLADNTISNDLAAYMNAGLTNAAGVEFDYNNFSGYPTNPITFWIDNVTVGVGAPPLPPPAVTNLVTVFVNVSSNRHAISPLIYGAAFATSNQVLDLNLTMNRSGGDNETRYNWQINAHNLDNDYYFESYPEPSAAPGQFADNHVANSKAGGAQPMITIPMIGWMPKLGNNRAITYSYSVAKYGAQTATDPYLSDAGNGVSSPSGTLITNNDPNDANFPTNVAFQSLYQQHLISNWGYSTNGGVEYYIMDNEHSIWFSTQRDVHPVGPTMQEILGKILQYSGMVKSNDPNALVCAPEEWGWSGYFYSGYDQQWSGAHNDYNPADYPDRKANGGEDYMPWLLGQLHQHDLTNGGRSIDYFTLHCYPQEGDVSGSDASPTTALLRNQSTRIFWDSNYVDPSWINAVVMLIPRMQGWVGSNYPGTKLGITEYNWGAESSMNGATAQADILGIFGWKGLDLATRWTAPTAGLPVYNAMKMYRNYDGHKSTFGDTSVADTVSTNVDDLSSFAAVRSTDGALTVMVINKQLTSYANVSVTVTNFARAGAAQQWQLNSSNLITQLSNVTFSAGQLSAIVRPESVTLFVAPAAALSPPTPGFLALPSTLGTVSFVMTNGMPGGTYILEASTNLAQWTPIQTNVLTTTSNLYALPISAGAMYYRAIATP